jgi:hypothetical protein
MINLKNVLTINAVSSGITGLALIAFHDTVASLMHTDSSLPIVGVGVFLFIFALGVFSESRKELHYLNGTRIIIALDILWVIVSLSLVAFELFQLSTIGYIVIAAVAMWVALMAMLQIKGLKQVIISKK